MSACDSKLEARSKVECGVKLLENNYPSHRAAIVQSAHSSIVLTVSHWLVAGLLSFKQNLVPKNFGLDVSFEHMSYTHITVLKESEKDRLCSGIATDSLSDYGLIGTNVHDQRYPPRDFSSGIE